MDVHIASMPVYTRPEHLSQVKRALARMDGVEVHAAAPSGKIVITLETTDESQILDTTNRIRDLAGVYTANLVYHQVESAEALEELTDGQDKPVLTVIRGSHTDYPT